MPDDMHPDNALYVIPSSLQRELGKWRPTASFVPFSPATYFPTNREPIVEELLPQAWSGHLYFWGKLLIGLSNAWWAPQRFPHSLLDPYGHPARLFVSACLLWDPDSICAKIWMGGRPLEILHTTHNIPGSGPPTPDPWREYLVEYSEMLSISIEDAFRADGVLTKEAYNEIHRTALAAAERAQREALRRRSEVSYAYVPILPGMTGKDWRALEPHAVAAAEELQADASPFHWRMIARQIAVGG